MKIGNSRSVVWAVFLVALFLRPALSKQKEKGGKPDKKGRTKVVDFENKLTVNRDSLEVEFPEELDFEFITDGKDVLKSKAKSVAGSKPMAAVDSRGRKNMHNKKNEKYYVDGKGSYKVSASLRMDGTTNVDTKATYKTGTGEKCFLARGESHCWSIDGEGEFGLVSLDGDMQDMPIPDRTSRTNRRSRRQDGPLLYTDFDLSLVLKVVYVVDGAFINWFREFSDDDQTALEDAEDYIYMLNNEITYLYRGIKDVSEANDSMPNTDIVVYAQGLYFPEVGTEWDWLEPFVSNDGIRTIGSPTSDALMYFGMWVGAGSLDAVGPFDTAVFISPRRLRTANGGSLLGIAYSRTTCNPGYKSYRVSMNEDRFFDVANTVAHELAHGIGSRHDGARDVPCPSRQHIMSGAVFKTTEANKDTWNRWSTCSVNDIVNHISRFSGCLRDASPSEEDFLDQLCKGVRATDQFDINYQCRTATKDQTSRVCSPSVTVSSGRVPPDACWDDRQVSLNCTDSAGRCNQKIFTVFDGTPCIGSNLNKDYVCFRGDCVEKVNVCEGRNPENTNPTQPPTTSKSTTTTQPPTTTTSKSSTTTTTQPTTTSKSTTTTQPPPPTTSKSSTTTTTQPPPTTTTTSSTTSTSTTTTTTTTTTTRTAAPPQSCNCQSGSRFTRWRCCRSERNSDGSCCNGCRRNRRGCRRAR